MKEGRGGGNWRGWGSPHCAAISPRVKISCTGSPMRDRDLRPLVPGADPPLPPGSGTLLPRPRRASLRPPPGRGSAHSPARRGPFPGYLLSRQAIHSAEEEEWAACAATMMGSGARRPPAAATSRARSAAASPPPRPPRGPAPPGPPRARRGDDAPALPAACRAGDPRGGTRGPRCTAAPGGGESRGPARCGEGAGGRPRVAGHLRLVAAASRGDLSPTTHLGASEAWRGERRRGWGWGDGCQCLCIFHTANATKMAAASLFP